VHGTAVNAMEEYSKEAAVWITEANGKGYKGYYIYILCTMKYSKISRVSIEDLC
jgi:hypothetical protein